MAYNPLKEHKGYYLTLNWEDKGVHIFPKGISPKMNIESTTEVRTRWQRCRSSRRYPLLHGDNPISTSIENSNCLYIIICIARSKFFCHYSKRAEKDKEILHLFFNAVKIQMGVLYNFLETRLSKIQGGS